MSSKNLKALLAQQAELNQKSHREADYSDDFDVGRRHTKIPLEQITVGSYQPRLTFSEEKLRALADSIAEVGLTQPVTVRPFGNGYELICGERRLRAHRLLNKPTIEAIVVDVDEGTAAAMALSENIDREDLTDWEIAAGIRRLEVKYPKRAHLAKALNLARSELYRYLAFHDLPDSVKARLQLKPDLIGRRAASELAQALKQNPDLTDRLGEALDKIAMGELEQGGLISFLEQPRSANTQQERVQSEKPAKTPSSKPTTYLTRGEARIGSIARTSTQFVIKLSNEALPEEKAAKLQEFLRELLEEGT